MELWGALDTESRVQRIRAAMATLDERGILATASEIAAVCGTTRNAIVGMHARHGEKIGRPLMGRKPSVVRGGAGKPARTAGLKPTRRRRCAPVLYRTVDEFIAKNGVRRFERGACSDFTSIQVFLRERGYRLVGTWNRYVLAHGGSVRMRLKWQDVLEVVDDLRAREGLEPMVRRGEIAA